MTKQVKIKIKHSLLAILLMASGGFFVLMSFMSGASQAYTPISVINPKTGFYDADIIKTFYEERSMRPLWVRGQGDFQPRATAILLLLENSWTHGLNPEKYHTAEIKQMLGNRSAVQNVELDMVLSDGVVRYARDLTGMRDKSHVSYDQVNYWRQPLAADEIMKRVSEAGDPVKILRDMEPGGQLYTALRTELIRLSKTDMAQNEPIKISKSIKPGKSDPKIFDIRQRLGVEYSGNTPEYYDDELASRVMTLQREYGFEDNGVITPAVMAIVNMGAREKMMQIIVNMERLRWLDQDRPNRYVLVNIPSASLWAVDDGQIALEMPVIVGKEARPTYSFKTEITGVRFNPNWTVPPTIKKADFLPMLQQDPYALTKRGIELVYNGQTVDPGKVNWSTLSSRGLHNIRMVQGPSDTNPLGKVRVIMENPYNIYLHDTNHREIFSQKERNLSSGCIRVAEPEKLADFILSKNDDWNWNGMLKMIDSGRMRDVKTAANIPVYITYQTIWLDSDGRLVYGRDIYGQDKKLSGMLEKSKSIHIPAASKNAAISL